MIRTQIQLDEARYRKLQEIARERGVSMAEVVRRAVDMALSQFERRNRWDRARALIGSYSSRRTDVAEKHDKYLAEAFRR